MHAHTHTGNIEECRKEVIFSGRRGGMEGVVGHTNHVLAIAVSSDGKFMVSKKKGLKIIAMLCTVQVLCYMK